MALVVFMRGVNVGGHRTFRPGVLAKELANLDVVNVGAAGTLVVRKNVSQAALKAELNRKLPFEPELMICRDRELLELARMDPFANLPQTKDARGFVSVLGKSPRTTSPLPISQPPGDDWQVKIVRIHGRFALSLWRRMGPRLIYPNEVVEKKLGVPATTRNWDTIETICEILKK